jgi:membrane protein implicated in regulation of membrane protease activity
VLPLYIASLGLGGVVLLISLAGGHGDGHGDAGADHGDHGAHAEAESAHNALLLPFLSLRFWTFAAAFFGLTGLVLGGLGLAAPALVPFIAGGVGLGSGYAASQIFRALARKPLGQLGTGGHVGREGKLLLPVGPSQRGKLRLSVAGQQVDLIAETTSERALPAGAPVLIIDMRGAVAVVEPVPLLEGRKEPE